MSARWCRHARPPSPEHRDRQRKFASLPAAPARDRCAPHVAPASSPRARRSPPAPPTAPPSVIGSRGVTSNSSDPMNARRPHARDRSARRSRHPTSTATRDSTSLTTPAGEVPSAMRMPSSMLRRADRVRRDAIQAYGREQQRQRTEEARERRDDPLLRDRRAHLILERAHRERELRVHARDGRRSCSSSALPATRVADRTMSFMFDGGRFEPRQRPVHRRLRCLTRSTDTPRCHHADDLDRRRIAARILAPRAIMRPIGFSPAKYFSRERLVHDHRARATGVVARSRSRVRRRTSCRTSRRIRRDTMFRCTMRSGLGRAGRPGNSIRRTSVLSPNGAVIEKAACDTPGTALRRLANALVHRRRVPPNPAGPLRANARRSGHDPLEPDVARRSSDANVRTNSAAPTSSTATTPPAPSRASRRARRAAPTTSRALAPSSRRSGRHARRESRGRCQTASPFPSRWLP